ncbi:hypothetical protein [Halosegnis sp.]|uniref:DUF7331 family protein n=1 Tax=Halosegnis sp. TaxID=2864959 RepID=UPI0035D4A078
MSLPDTVDAGLPVVNRSFTAIDRPDGGLVVYDLSKPAAWLRTDAPVTLTEWE